MKSLNRARYVLGLLRAALAPGEQLEHRDRSRRVLQKMAREQFRLTGRLQQRVRPIEGELFPSLWRSLRSEVSEGDLGVVVLSELVDAEPVLATLRRSGFAPEVILLRDAGRQSDGGQVLPAPAGWGPAARLIAVVNSGRLDSYKQLVVVTRDAPELAGIVSAALPALTGDLACGLIVQGRTLDPSAVERKRVQGLLLPREVRLSVDSWQSPASLDFVGRAFLVQGLRCLRMGPEEFQSLHGADSERVLSMLLGALSAEAGCRVESAASIQPAPGASAVPPLGPRARVIPFYLPQFHPTVENDEWWGKGFTEWANVAGAIPCFHGHQQPKLPEDLGFYDLRLDAVREQQAALASDHGVEGFMYYHYWFAGRRMLETPVDSLVRNPAIGQPFCLMWANENWTRTWDGLDSHVLLAQDYDRVPAEEFITHVLPYMKDPRYLRVDGCAVLSVYRPQAIPDFAKVLEGWRDRAAAEGIDLFILAVGRREGMNPAPWSSSPLDLDGSMDFPPHTMGLPPHQVAWVPATQVGQWDSRFRGRVFSYAEFVMREEKRLAAGLEDHEYPAVMPSWDNTARRQWKPTIWVEANPYTFRRWLVAALRAVAARPPQHRIVFVNAWNEWAEGAMLEPSVQYGRTYLLAIRDAVVS